jgi:hypothetical protein
VTLRNFIHVTDRELHRAGDVRGRTPFEPPRGRAALLSERSPNVRIQPRTNRPADFVSRSPERRREQPNPVINRRSPPQGSGPVQADTNRDAFIRRNPGSERRNAPVGGSGLGQPRIGPAGRNDRIASAAPRTNPPRQQREAGRLPRGRSGEQPDSMAGPRGPRAPRVNGSLNGSVNGGRPNSNGDPSSDAQPGRGRGRR